MHVFCLPSIASVVLVLGSPPAAPTREPAELPAGAITPLRARKDAPPLAPDLAWLPVHGVAPLTYAVQGQSPAPASSWPEESAAPLRAPIPDQRSPSGSWLPAHGIAPLNIPGPDGGAAPTIAAPFGRGPSLTPDRPDPRTLRMVRLELLVGAMWRIRTAETLVLASLEAGRLQGFSGTFHAGVIVDSDRQFVGVSDFPIGGGFVARRRLGQRSLFGSVGFTVGILVHRATTDLGVVHRVDPDFQLPLRFGWTAGRVGLSVALLQGFSVRTRTYSRRGVEVWQRIPYRIGFAVGLHFDVGVGRAKPRRSTPHRRETP